MRTALTIAGSDSGGGAGLQADLKTFAAHGVYGTSAVTAVTVQNTRGVFGVLPLPPEIVVDQIRAVLDDFGADAVKIGMLATAAIVEAVVDMLGSVRPRHLVLDTVFASSGGRPLLDPRGVEVLRSHLVPLAEVVTANLEEAAALTGSPVTSVADARDAARSLHARGARAVVVKGGHLEGPAIDVLYDGERFTEFSSPRVHTRHTHGTGCTFASAIAARLALGASLDAAVEGAKAYVIRALERAPGLGGGHGPLGHYQT